MTPLVLGARFGVLLSLSALLAVSFAASPAISQKPGPQKPGPHPHVSPGLPPSARSSRPVSSGVHTQMFKGSGPSSGVNSATWTAFGPAALQSDMGLVSGRVTGLAVDPTDPKIIYLAAAGG